MNKREELQSHITAADCLISSIKQKKSITVEELVTLFQLADDIDSCYHHLDISGHDIPARENLPCLRFAKHCGWGCELNQLNTKQVDTLIRLYQHGFKRLNNAAYAYRRKPTQRHRHRKSLSNPFSCFFQSANQPQRSPQWYELQDLSSNEHLSSASNVGGHPDSSTGVIHLSSSGEHVDDTTSSRGQNHPQTARNTPNTQTERRHRRAAPRHGENFFDIIFKFLDEEEDRSDPDNPTTIYHWKWDGQAEPNIKTAIECLEQNKHLFSSATAADTISSMPANEGPIANIEKVQRNQKVIRYDVFRHQPSHPNKKIKTLSLYENAITIHQTDNKSIENGVLAFAALIKSRSKNANRHANKVVIDGKDVKIEQLLTTLTLNLTHKFQVAISSQVLKDVIYFESRYPFPQELRDICEQMARQQHDLVWRYLDQNDKVKVLRSAINRYAKEHIQVEVNHHDGVKNIVQLDNGFLQAEGLRKDTFSDTARKLFGMRAR